MNIHDWFLLEGQQLLVYNGRNCFSFGSTKNGRTPLLGKHETLIVHQIIILSNHLLQILVVDFSLRVVLEIILWVGNILLIWHRKGHWSHLRQILVLKVARGRRMSVAISESTRFVLLRLVTSLQEPIIALQRLFRLITLHLSFRLLRSHQILLFRGLHVEVWGEHRFWAKSNFWSQWRTQLRVSSVEVYCLLILITTISLNSSSSWHLHDKVTQQDAFNLFRGYLRSGNTNSKCRRFWTMASYRTFTSWLRPSRHNSSSSTSWGNLHDLLLRRNDAKICLMIFICSFLGPWLQTFILNGNRGLMIFWFRLRWSILRLR